MANKTDYTAAEFRELLDGEFSYIKIKLEQSGPGNELKIIGKGTFGRIFEVQFDGATCAARELDPDLKRKTRNCMRSFAKQYLLNCRNCWDLRHPNIIQFFGVASNDAKLSAKPKNPPILQVMEKMDCSLNSLIERPSDIPPSTKLSIMRDVAAGLKYLHCRSPPVVHCYLSSNNVLLTAHGHQWKAKITDVWLAQMVKGDKSSLRQSMIFMAPEISKLSRKSGTQSLDNPAPSADVFSYGGIMLHIIKKQWPEESVISSIWQKKKESTNNQLNGLMASCLDKECRNRPQITSVLAAIKAYITSPTIAEAEQQLDQIYDAMVIKQQVEKPIKGNKTMQQQNQASDESNEKDNVEHNSSEQGQVQGQANIELATDDIVSDRNEQDSIKDVNTSQQQSSRDCQQIQDGSKKNEDDDSVVKEIGIGQKQKDQTAIEGDCTFDRLGPKVVGFYNEGNTCFFNAMLQCIHQTVGLHDAIAESKRGYKREYTIETSKGLLPIKVAKKPGQLTIDMQRLFYDISRQTGPISPHHLLQLIGERYSRFGHGTQEDSHEVLRCLISILREEEIECINQEIRLHYGLKEDFLTDQSVDGETRLYVKECLSKVSKGVCDIDRIFGCHLINTTICHECKNPLQTTEFHIDLSLPMPEGNSQAKDNNHSEAQSKSSKKRNKKKKKNKQHITGYATTSMQADTCSLKESIKIPEVVSCQQKLNLHLQKWNLAHCGYSNANDLKLETDLERCLLAFTSIDTLDQDNKFICQTCSCGKPEIKLCCVSKQILIHKLSPVLILHIKRFIIASDRVTKDHRVLSFPNLLDMAPFCTTECIKTLGDKDRKIIYSLYAVVEHNGSLHGGHYKAYVKRRPFRKTKDGLSIMRSSKKHTDVTAKEKCCHSATEGEWYCTNDSRASKCSVNSFKHCQPFILFYEILPNHDNPELPKDSIEGEPPIAMGPQETKPDQMVKDSKQHQIIPLDREHQDSLSSEQLKKQEKQNDCVNSHSNGQRQNNISQNNCNRQQSDKLQEDREQSRNDKQPANNSQLDTDSLAKTSPEIHNENDNLLLCSSQQMQQADGDNCTEVKPINNPDSMQNEYPEELGENQQNKLSQKNNRSNKSASAAN